MLTIAGGVILGVLGLFALGVIVSIIQHAPGFLLVLTPVAFAAWLLLA